MSNINEQVLQEIIISKDNQRFDRFTNLKHAQPSIPIPHSLQGYTHKSNFQLDSWQTEIISNINRRVDMLVNISPAGGKSRPIQNAWKKMILDSDIPTNMPRILWVCENKTLTSEVYNNFREIILDIIGSGKQGLSHISNPTQMFDPNPEFLNQIKRSVDDLVCIKMQSAPGKITNRTLAASCTYAFAEDIVKQLTPRIIVIDEIQERFKGTTPGVGYKERQKEIHELDERVTALIKTIRIAPPPN